MKLVWRAALTSLLIVSFVAATAEAGNVTKVTTHTKIKLSDTSIKKGDDLFIVGRIRSANPKCYINRVVQLFFNGDKVASSATDSNGKAYFKRNPNKTGKWQTKFGGAKFKVHPDRFYCLPSHSKKRTVTVS
ncbi:MAG TPA: hypothetical protein VK646_13115 [Actinomycetota bacterium]|nr:hypothetical protein [Actinomycetota bacterium]